MFFCLDLSKLPDQVPAVLFVAIASRCRQEQNKAEYLATTVHTLTVAFWPEELNGVTSAWFFEGTTSE